MNYQFDNSVCLNGWWDILPIYTKDPEPIVPQDGWLEGKYLVPSVWTKPFEGVRTRGETYFKDCSAVFDGGDWEFLFDAYDYPLEWSRTRCGWVRRTIDIERLDPGTRWFLQFEGVMSRAKLFINGMCVGNHIHPTLPFEVDITDQLRAGSNEVALLIEPFECDDRGRAKVPTGSWIPSCNSGIWQDVYLVRKSDVYVSDVKICTSTRNKTISVSYDVSNASDRKRYITLKSDIVHWAKGIDHSTLGSALDLPNMQLTVAAGGSASVEFTVSWPDAQWWYPENPKLYMLRTTTMENDIALDTTFERFGFREVWIDGPSIMLNDYPLHLFSDWGHKMTPFAQTEGWIRKWFGMLSDANMNHSRLHTHPHPRIYLDLADEEGILITNEAGIHGSGGGQAGDSPDYWSAAEDHIRRFVKRDKNHPSVIMWSVENEMRHNLDRTSLPLRRLPELRKLFNELDPTRPAYHEGDSSLWSEKTQDIVSRHYGRECAGIGWWDRTKPLLSGEMGLYHYAGPNNTLHLAGDAAWSSFKKIDEAAARDAALIIETGRTLGISCFGPWNLSCLENLRMETERVKLEYDDFTAPGVKPFYVEPHSCEFSFWKDGKGYTPNHCFPIQANAFRPFAVIDRSLRNSYFPGANISREVFIVNDTTNEVHGTLHISIEIDENVIRHEKYDVTISRGDVTSVQFSVLLQDDVRSGACNYKVCFINSSGEVLDNWSRSWKIGRKHIVGISEQVAIFGSGKLAEALNNLGVSYSYIDSLDSEKLPDFGVLIMENDTVCPGSNQNLLLLDFVRRGGRVIIMEQQYSVFPGVALIDRPVLSAFVRSHGHDVLDGIDDGDLFAWGDDPYSLTGDSAVADRMYVKDDGRHILPLLDSGDGGFGIGDLSCTPLFETYIGDGLVIACQLRLTNKMNDIPAASRLFTNMVKRAVAYVPVKKHDPIVVDGACLDNIEELAAKAAAGDTILVNGVTAESSKRWAGVLDIDLRTQAVDEVYQAIRVSDSPLLAGISNEDTCGIETWVYAPPGSENCLISDTAIVPTENIEALLETPTESCLRELMVYGGKAEPLRAHTLSRFLYAEKPDRAVVLGLVRTGKGKVIFNQITSPLNKPDRFARYLNRLLGNLGVEFDGNVLDGNGVTIPEPNSLGYATKIYVLGGSDESQISDELIESTRLQFDHLDGSRTLSLHNWKEVSSDTGIWRAAELGEADSALLYYRVYSPTARKDLRDIGVGNPAALTHIDLMGEGRACVILNGHAFEQVNLAQDELATINNVKLEKGWNNVLVSWNPRSEKSELKMQWRDIDGRPEVELKYE